MEQQEKIRIGVIGCGVIGNALINWIRNNNSNCIILRSDPLKGYTDDITQADIIFISIHIPTVDGKQELTALENIIKTCPNIPIFIRTTLLPGTCDNLAKKYNKDINFMPEFLTERNAQECFDNQPLIFTNHSELLQKIFIGKNFIKMSSLEAEVAKYSHNVFGALKVTYFNGIYELCQKLKIDYENVKQGTLLSGYINKPHTLVPGPDGNFGYNGKCFPKDVEAFINFTKGLNLNQLIQQLPEINEKYKIN